MLDNEQKISQRLSSVDWKATTSINHAEIKFAYGFWIKFVF